MASSELRFRKSVARDLRPLSKQDVKRLLQCMGSLAHDPRPSGFEKLSGAGRCRMRLGRYRISYEIGADRLLIIAVTATRPRSKF